MKGWREGYTIVIGTWIAVANCSGAGQGVKTADWHPLPPSVQFSETEKFSGRAALSLTTGSYESHLSGRAESELRRFGRRNMARIGFSHYTEEQWKLGLLWVSDSLLRKEADELKGETGFAWSGGDDLKISFSVQATGQLYNTKNIYAQGSAATGAQFDWQKILDPTSAYLTVDAGKQLWTDSWLRIAPFSFKTQYKNGQFLPSTTKVAGQGFGCYAKWECSFPLTPNLKLTGNGYLFHPVKEHAPDDIDLLFGWKYKLSKGFFLSYRFTFRSTAVTEHLTQRRNDLSLEYGF